MTTKKSTKRIALLTALVLITSLFLGISVARYVTNVGSEDEARVAIWGIEGDTVTMELFDSKYDANGNRIAESSDGDKIIAPGTSRSSAFSIMDVNSTIAPEVMYEVGINLDDSEIAPEILANPSIQWRLDTNDWGTWEECKEDILNLTGSTGGKKVYAPNTLPDSFADGQEHTIAWQWLMDNGTDVEDTEMGNAAVRGDLKATIKVSVTARQVDIDTTGMIEGLNQTFDINNPEPLVFKSIAPLSELQSVKVGTTTLTEGEHYTKADGSTIITLKESYLSTLPEGRYVISIVSTSMTAKANFTVKEVSPNPLAHNGIIPEGGVYYTNVQYSDSGYAYTNDYYDRDTEKDYLTGTKYSAGEEFPELKLGDVYLYDGYEYRYGFAYTSGGVLWCSTGHDGWGAFYMDEAETHPSELLVEINNKPLTHLEDTFYSTNIIQSPSIPKSVISLRNTYLACENLTGIIDIKAENVVEFTDIFSYTSREISLKGSCPQIEEIASGYNNVTVIE